jgi:hypothetical protein
MAEMSSGVRNSEQDCQRNPPSELASGDFHLGLVSIDAGGLCKASFSAGPAGIGWG